MRLAAILLAACTAACSSGIDFPEETGAPPRPMPPDLRVSISERDLSAMPRYATGGFASGRTYAYADHCEIILPRASTRPDYRRTVSMEDQAHIKAHEMRHCTGQQHDRREVSPGVFVIVWLP